MKFDGLEEILRLHSLWLGGEAGGVRADLPDEDLVDEDLSGADLSGANLNGAHMTYATLKNTNLSGADLDGASFYCADLSGANLSGADLTGADLNSANLDGANLSGANLTDADLRRANFTETTIYDFRIPQSGDLVGFKKVRGGFVLELLIPDGSRRTASLTGNKCRCERAFVARPLNSDLKVFGSMHDPEFMYRVGEFVEEQNYNPDPREECLPGIHFFLTKEEAESY